MISGTIEKLEAIADVRFEDVATFDGVKVNYRSISEWSETAKLALLDTVVKPMTVRSPESQLLRKLRRYWS
jgi:hypothetical protein